MARRAALSTLDWIKEGGIRLEHTSRSNHETNASMSAGLFLFLGALVLFLWAILGRL
jgi:hypothetical protein